MLTAVSWTINKVDDSRASYLVLRIRIRIRIHMFLGLQDPDPSIIKQN